MKRMIVGVAALVLVVYLGCPAPQEQEGVEKSGPLPGAIFTTTEDGSIVNENVHYEAKEDVYLDGGPGPNAPPGAAGLPEGDYYFQVTDPSGKVLLSEDPIKCRRFHVNEFGVIDAVYSESYTAYERIRGRWVETVVDCTHATGIDQDHSEVGAITVQLFPYADTPNKGGVYKVWITPVEDFTGDPEQIDNPGQFHGFIPRFSKTDNYKVKKRGKPCDAPVLDVLKFNDRNFNGVLDFDEEEIAGWGITIEDPLAVVNNYNTPVNVVTEPAGLWIVREEERDGWLPTAVYIDAVAQADPLTEADVLVAGDCGEIHQVVFLNGQTGSIKACKGYDVNGDGVDDNVSIEGFMLCLNGVNVRGEVVSMCALTGEDGCVTLDDLLPGTYTVSEVIPPESTYQASTPTEVVVELESGEEAEVSFLNFCTGTAVMHTKGFWQNSNGCAIVSAHTEYLTFLNGLAPYASGTYATNGQDNCGGVVCPSTTILPFDSANELGCYIVAPNNQDPRLGLAQQLAAFILNAIDQLEGFDSVLLPSGLSAQEIIDSALVAYAGGDAAAIQFWQSLLDSLNNAGTIDFIAGQPCDVVYPD